MAEQSNPLKTPNPFPRLRLYLAPVPGIRSSLDDLETHWRRMTTIIPLPSTAPYRVLTIIRAAVDQRQADTIRVRHGIVLLLRDVLRMQPTELQKCLTKRALLQRYGVIRRGENPVVSITPMIGYLKALKLPLANASRSVA